jgi:hypothetical protein
VHLQINPYSKIFDVGVKPLFWFYRISSLCPWIKSTEERPDIFKAFI